MGALPCIIHSLKDRLIQGRNTPITTIPDHQLIRRIGAGVYGEVWLARNVMGTYRAVVVYREHRQRPALRARVQRHSEIRADLPFARGLVDVLQVAATIQPLFLLRHGIGR